MNTGMVADKPSVVLDTNIIISAIGFGGKPRKILNLVLENHISVVTSPILLVELEDIIFKKFPLLAGSFERINRQIKKKFKIVRPKTSLYVLKDEPDNRVLEAALEGESQYIITGDKELLNLKSFKTIKIITADEFLAVLGEN